ncbi:hypothetical protein [Cereibacter sphaeroides]|uniref:hypothetical protein n=1 Tax=Cereibacter sphaeroides TaxID=1063 RepID=UPI00118F12C1|nr:hypothetical protein [Cereibacter sphaeroides]GEM94353.1 hypothetical protein RSP03_34200 [Cereibacter sphaeroides]
MRLRRGVVAPHQRVDGLAQVIRRPARNALLRQHSRQILDMRTPERRQILRQRDRRRLRSRPLRLHRLPLRFDLVQSRDQRLRVGAALDGADQVRHHLLRFRDPPVAQTEVLGLTALLRLQLKLELRLDLRVGRALHQEIQQPLQGKALDLALQDAREAGADARALLLGAPVSTR